MNLQEITELTGGPLFEPLKKEKNNTIIYIVLGGFLIYGYWNIKRNQKTILKKLEKKK